MSSPSVSPNSLLLSRAFPRVFAALSCARVNKFFGQQTSLDPPLDKYVNDLHRSFSTGFDIQPKLLFYLN